MALKGIKCGEEKKSQRAGKFEPLWPRILNNWLMWEELEIEKLFGNLKNRPRINSQTLLPQNCTKTSPKLNQISRIVPKWNRREKHPSELPQNFAFSKFFRLFNIIYWFNWHVNPEIPPSCITCTLKTGQVVHPSLQRFIKTTHRSETDKLFLEETWGDQMRSRLKKYQILLVCLLQLRFRIKHRLQCPRLNF